MNNKLKAQLALSELKKVIYAVIKNNPEGIEPVSPEHI